MASVKGGDKARKVLAEIGAKIGKGRAVEVGFLRGATYPNGTPVALIAAIHNYGAPRAGIPPRPFFSNAIVKYSPQWPGTMANLLKVNDYNVSVTLGQMGEGIKGQIQQSIRDTVSPPLKPATIKRKGFVKPLIDTGHMLNSVNYRVLD